MAVLSVETAVVLNRSLALALLALAFDFVLATLSIYSDVHPVLSENSVGRTFSSVQEKTWL
jgi:hypothetical protein